MQLRKVGNGGVQRDAQTSLRRNIEKAKAKAKQSDSEESDSEEEEESRYTGMLLCVRRDGWIA